MDFMLQVGRQQFKEGEKNDLDESKGGGRWLEWLFDGDKSRKLSDEMQPPKKCGKMC